MTQQTIEMISVNQIFPNSWNRSEFDSEGLKELAASIEAVGVLVPILVRPNKRAVEQQNSGAALATYQLIAGERRWRACQMLKLETIPALVRELSDVEAQQEALIENIQREDIDPITEAQGYERLVKEYKVPQTDLAKRVGKSKGYISSQIRILSLPKEIWPEFSRENLTRTHAVQLLRLNDSKLQIRFAKTIGRMGWSANETTKRVDRALGVTVKTKAKGKAHQIEESKPGIFPFKLEGFTDGVKLVGKTPVFYELVVPIKWKETDIEAVWLRALEVIRRQRDAWKPVGIIKNVELRMKNVKHAVNLVEQQEHAANQAAKRAKAAGASEDEQVREGLKAAMPGVEITDEMIRNLRRASQP